MKERKDETVDCYWYKNAPQIDEERARKRFEKIRRRILWKKLMEQHEESMQYLPTNRVRSDQGDDDAKDLMFFAKKMENWY